MTASEEKFGILSAEFSLHDRDSEAIDSRRDVAAE